MKYENQPWLDSDTVLNRQGLVFVILIKKEKIYNTLQHVHEFGLWAA